MVFSAWLKSFVDLSISILAFHFAARTYLWSALKNNFSVCILFFFCGSPQFAGAVVSTVVVVAVIFDESFLC